MKGTRRRNKSATGVSRRAVMVTEWRRLGAASIGTDELVRIQQAISQAFGEHVVESPASIARELALEGAELRHPEIIECDARWREAQIATQAKRLSSLEILWSDKPLRFRQAESLLKKLEKLRRRLERVGDEGGLKEIKILAIDVRQAAVNRAKDKTIDEALRDEQSEIAKWLTIWLQTPNLFADWIELRRRSPDFRKKFLTKTSS